VYAKTIHKAWLKDPWGWILQEDNDPSHGTRSTYNVAYLYKLKNWLYTIVHLLQSPDLNPIEGIWNILKQRTKRRLYYLEDSEEQWDGTLRHLKVIFRQEWDKITM
jgi:hypothetical protein